MITLYVLGRKGHEEFRDLTPEEAKGLIHDVESASGQRYFVADKNTQTLLKELKLQEDQELVMIPVAVGG